MVRLSSTILCAMCAFLLTSLLNLVTAQQINTSQQTNPVKQIDSPQQPDQRPPFQASGQILEISKQETLSVLYAGEPRSDRMAETVGFLVKHFARVGTCDSESNFEAIAEDYDVVVVDRTPHKSVGPNEQGAPSNVPVPVTIPSMRLSLPKNRPVLLMGPDTRSIYHFVQRLDLSVNYVQGYAHDINTNHPIFKRPLPVELALEEIASPRDYFLNPRAKNVGEPLQTWKIQEEGSNLGTAIDKLQFSSSTNTEVIACGLNELRQNQVALYRNGNLFVWGFTATPTHMTPAAQSVFVNSICYIADFKDSQWQPLQANLEQRDVFLQCLYELRRLNNDHFNASLKDYRSMQLPLSINTAEEALKDSSTYLKDYVKKDVEQVLLKINPEILKEFNGDHEKLLQHFTENLEYLCLDDYMRYQVDNDVKSLGVSNREPKFLERCSTMLNFPDQAELGQRLLSKYVYSASPEVKDWKVWYIKNKASLKHSSWLERFVPTSEMLFDTYFSMPLPISQRQQFIPITSMPFPVMYASQPGQDGTILPGQLTIPPSPGIPAAFIAQPPSALYNETVIVDPAATTVPRLTPETTSDTAEHSPPALPPTFRKLVPEASAVKPSAK